MNKYSNRELELLVQELCGYSAEQTWFEFKRDNDDPERIGKYISALSNCACAENQPFGYLVWGIDDTMHNIVGTHFDPDTSKKGNQHLTLWLHTQLCPELSFEFYKAVIQGKNIVVLEIEAAYRQPVSFMKTAWGRIGESLVELSKLPKVTEQIFMTVGKDWSAETILGASYKDLDEEALIFAREKYASADEVFVTLHGKILDERYTQLLMSQPTLSLTEILMLDKIQKGIAIPKNSADCLRKKHLIEGRYPHIYPTAELAVKTATEEEYLERRGFSDSLYIQKILQYIRLKGQATRSDIEGIIRKYLPSFLSEDQKSSKIANLISLKMARRMHCITNVGSRTKSSWILTDIGKVLCKKGFPDCKKDCKKGNM